MKKCPYCGLENSDEAQQCTTCHTELVPPAESSTAEVMSAEEQRFWAHLTLRDFAILIVRLQALWVLFPVIAELTYLPGYLSVIFPARRFDLLPPDMKQTFYLALLRIVLRAGVGIGAFVYADRLLSWLARGLIGLRAEPNASPNVGSAGAPPASVN